MISQDVTIEPDIHPNAETSYKALRRAIQRGVGFSLLFVRCTPVKGEEIVERIQADLPQKRIEVLNLDANTENLYHLVENLSEEQSFDVLFIRGLEESLFQYEDREQLGILGRSKGTGYGGNWESIPRILGNLNLSRERFRDNFKLCFVFLLPEFALNYFIRRAPDFFDWRSNVYEFPTDRRIIEELSQQILKDTEWEIYTNFSEQERGKKMNQIRALLEEESQLPDQKAKLFREYGRLLSTDNKNKKTEEVMAYFNEALTLKPDFYEALRSQGNVLRDLGRYQEAITSFDKALEINPNFYEAWRSRGNVLSILGRNEEAISSYDRALQIDDKNYEAWCNRGNILVRLGRNEEAIASYDKALQIKPHNYILWLSIGNVLDIVGRYEEARLSYKTALENRPQNEKRYELDMAINRVFQCNLPPRIYSKFIGRESEIKKLMKFLSPTNRKPYITIAGIGGMGKTALAIESAYRCLEAKLDDNQDPQIPKFEKIIFISAQDSFLLPDGINTRESSIHRLGDISRAISKALGDYSTMSVSPEAQSKLIIEALKSKGQILIIVDNLETLGNPEEILEFLDDLPNNVKSIVTSRKLSDGMYVPIKLGALSNKECLELLQQAIQKVNISMNEEDKKSLCLASGGIPIVIIYSIGRLCFGSSMQNILDELASGNNDVTKFCFQKLFESLETNSIKLMFALSLFPFGVNKEGLLKVSGMEKEIEITITGELEKLEQVSLIHCQEGKYKILPPTREYVQLKLAEHPICENDARRAWKKWYLSRTEDHGGDDWGNWHQDYDVIESEWGNLLELLRWCKSKNDYKTVWKLWTRLNKIAYLYGHWNERIQWLNYLINEFERHNELKKLVEVMSSKAWTMIQMESEENLNEAKEILERAWLLRSNAPEISYIIATNLAVLNIRKRLFNASDFWFVQAKESLEKIKDVNNENNEKAISRGEIRINYYLGEKEHRLRNYEQAKKYLKDVESNALEINWLRLVSASKELLADIAIRDGKIIEAEQLLTEGMPIAEKNKDVRRLAFYLRSSARLEKLKGNFKVSLTYASSSLDLFEKLKMDKKAQSVRDFISEVEMLQTST